MNASPVGFFDSGIGGTCVLEAFEKMCPFESTVYMADSANCPYGGKSRDEVLRLSRMHAMRLRTEWGCKMVVVACNTATAAAIDELRRESPDFPYVGIEPAVKPAALNSRTGVVGVLATEGTFNGRLYRETKEKFAKDVTIIATVADEFVEMVEKGETSGDAAEAKVRARIEPLLASGCDSIVLGCTHFPHLKRLIEKVAAGRAAVIDPSEAVARRAKAVLEDRGLAAPQGSKATHVFVR